MSWNCYVDERNIGKILFFIAGERPVCFKVSILLSLMENGVKKTLNSNN